MKLRLVQTEVRDEPAANEAKILSELGSAEAGEWVLFPEGMLSGFAVERDDFISALDQNAITDASDRIGAAARERQCHCAFGSAVIDGGKWYNALVLATHAADPIVHRKVELAQPERRHFAAGSGITDTQIADAHVGLLACRELLFADAWAALKRRGVQVVFHLNNALKAKDAVWRHLLIARAVEFGIYVCSVNCVTARQKLESYVISPSGAVILKTEAGRAQSLSATIDLANVIPDIQHRSDY